jgi:hypothetical protein
MASHSENSTRLDSATPCLCSLEPTDMKCEMYSSIHRGKKRKQPGFTGIRPARQDTQPHPWQPTPGMHHGLDVRDVAHCKQGKLYMLMLAQPIRMEIPAKGHQILALLHCDTIHGTQKGHG